MLVPHPFHDVQMSTAHPNRGPVTLVSGRDFSRQRGETSAPAVPGFGLGSGQVTDLRQTVAAAGDV